jgi:formylglycine-generating enzyme required for sulfatase activity
MKLVKVRDLFGPGKDCWVGKYEVSQGEYQLVMGANPSTNAVGTNFPVQNVSWEKAQEFCTKLRVSDPKMRIRGDYRLPTKEEWMKFAAGTPFAGAAIRSKAPMPVNFGNPNPQRLYNVLGNVWEWLADTDGTNASYIGYGFSGGFNLVFGTTETRSRTWSDNQVGFRVIMVPTDATSAAK